MRIRADTLGKVALRHGTEHLLGTLGCGEVIDEPGELPLHKPHPARAAGGEHGPGVAVPMGKAVDELAGLLHNSEVGGEIRVEYIVKADLLQGGDHPLGCGKFGVQVVVLCPGGPDRRSNLHHGDLLGVCQSVEDLAGVVPLLQGAHGTVGDALAAVGAVGVGDRAGRGNADGGVRAGAHQIPDVHALDLVTHLHAAHTAHAAVLDAHHGVGKVILCVFQILDVVVAQKVIVIGELLQLAVSAAGAFGAVGVMLAQKQPQIHPAGLPGPGRIGVYHHTLRYHIVAGGNQTLQSLDLHHAQPAGGDLVDVLEIAQGRNINVHRAGGLQNGGALRYRDRLFVNNEVYHLSTRPPLKMP